MLDYMRALGMRYSAMRGDEKVQLCRVCLWEACKRHFHDIKGDGQRRAKYDLVAALCQEAEFKELSFYEKTLFFIPENLSNAAPDLGYDRCKAYLWLKENGSIEGNLEMKTILNENYEQVTEHLYWVTHTYLEAQQGAELVDQQQYLEAKQGAELVDQP